jgi:hypothetical protein
MATNILRLTQITTSHCVGKFVNFISCSLEYCLLAVCIVLLGVPRLLVHALAILFVGGCV